MQSYGALYFPFIHFKNDDWLKLSALYWDSISRIVPYQYTPEDSATVRALGSVIETVRPNWVRPEFGENFVQFISEYRGKLRSRYALRLMDDVHHQHEWPVVPPQLRPPAAGGNSGSDARLGYVYFEKLTDDLRKELKDSDLARPDSRQPEWVGMHPRLAQVYMTALADQLATERGLRPLTDETIDHLAAGGWTIERLAQALLPETPLIGPDGSNREVEGVAAFIAITSVLPKDITQIPVKKILRFREKHLGERGAFQAYLSGFLEKREWLGRIDDRNLLEQRLREEYEKDLEPKLQLLRHQLQGFGIDTVTGVLSVQVAVPWLLSAVQDALNEPADAFTKGAGLAAGAALALTKVARDRQKARAAAIASAPASYLLRMEENLLPSTVLEWIKASASRVFPRS